MAGPSLLRCADGVCPSKGLPNRLRISGVLDAEQVELVILENRGSKYVTVIIDLTPIRDGTGPSRLLDMVPGRSKKVLKAWLDAQSQQVRNGIGTVAMDGSTGFKTAAPLCQP